MRVLHAGPRAVCIKQARLHLTRECCTSTSSYLGKYMNAKAISYQDNRTEQILCIPKLPMANQTPPTWYSRDFYQCPFAFYSSSNHPCKTPGRLVKQECWKLMKRHILRKHIKGFVCGHYDRDSGGRCTKRFGGSWELKRHKKPKEGTTKVTCPSQADKDKPVPRQIREQYNYIFKALKSAESFDRYYFPRCERNGYTYAYDYMFQEPGIPSPANAPSIASATLSMAMNESGSTGQDVDSGPPLEDVDDGDDDKGDEGEGGEDGENDGNKGNWDGDETMLYDATPEIGHTPVIEDYTPIDPRLLGLQPSVNGFTEQNFYFGDPELYASVDCYPIFPTSIDDRLN